MTRKTARTAGTILATLLLLFATGLLFLKSSWGEERARVVIERAVSRAIPGRFAMGRLGDFELFSPPGILRFTAEDARVLDRKNAEVLHVNEVIAEVDLFALARREIRIRKASVSGAQIPCDSETGRPKFPARPPRRTAFAPRAIGVRLENVDVVGLYSVATQSDGHKAVLGRLAGHVDVTVPRDMPGVQIRLRGVNGVLTQPRAVRLHDATGNVDTSAEKAADIEFSADASGAAVTGRLRYYPSDKDDPLKIDIENMRQLDGGSPLDALGGAGMPGGDVLLKMMGGSNGESFLGH